MTHIEDYSAAGASYAERDDWYEGGYASYDACELLELSVELSNITFVTDISERFEGPLRVRPKFRLAEAPLPINEFLDAVYQFQDNDVIRPGIAFIFSTVNDILGEGDVAACDAILERVDVSRLKTDLLLSFLTITFSARERLKNRKSYYALARRQIRRDVGWLEARRLLSGLN